MFFAATAIFVSSALASSCDASDKNIWDNKVEAQFAADEKHCALQCAGMNPCTGNCMSKTYGFSKACGQCFGGLSQCVVKHCVVGLGQFGGKGTDSCSSDPNGESCKTCSNTFCTPEFETCTGFTPPSLESPLDTSCSAADKTLWDTKIKAQFAGDEKHCAMQCAGQNPCTGNCMSKTYGFSQSCGQCFGGLSSCVVRNCVFGAGKPHGTDSCSSDANGQACKSCTDYYCTPTFESCSGFTPPAALESALTSSCDASDKSIWDNKVETQFAADEKHCALQCAGMNPCTGNCMSKTYGFSKACGQCFGGLSQCVVKHCVVGLGQFGGKGTDSCSSDPNGESCKTCSNTFCTPEFETCTGFTPPSLTKRLNRLSALEYAF